ncbi:PST-a related protein [Cyclospora cayetanensis]|uniref:PST-a related protein n=1 Tax=Cyclospora cayetanensis TaxID=88456 RepID=A0A1D3D9S8_9EIME|nr:PST-a related protein [Cyclospora cayetanensis]
MGSASSSSAKNGKNIDGADSTIPASLLPPLNWEALSSDTVSRSQVLRPSALDLHYYPLDGRPEHGERSTPHVKSVCKRAGESLFASCEDQQQQQKHGELCDQCKRESVKQSCGIVVLLHGYQSHARFSWLRRWGAPPPVKRDPRIHGYVLHEDLSLLLAANKAQDTVPALGSSLAATTVASATAAQPASEKDDSLEACGSCAGCLGDPQYRGSFVEHLNRLGFVVAAADLESQGLSEGWGGCRGGFREAEDLALDAMQLLHVLRRRMHAVLQEDEGICGKPNAEAGGELGAEGKTQEGGTAEGEKALEAGNTSTEDAILGNTELPVFLIGSSLGGWTAARCVELFRDSAAIRRALPAVASAAAAREGEQQSPEPLEWAAAAPCLRIQGLVLLSAMFDVAMAKAAAMWRYTRPFVQQLAVWAPHVHISKGTHTTKFKTETEHRQRDTLYIQEGTRARTACEILQKAEVPVHPDETAKIKESSCRALLVVHNTLDEQCGIEGALTFFKGVQLQDKTLLAINAIPPEREPGEEQQRMVRTETEQEGGQEGGLLQGKGDTQEHDGIARGSHFEPLHFDKRVSPELQRELQACADCSLNGLDVHHSIASESDGDVVLEKIAQWLQQRAIGAANSAAS